MRRVPRVRGRARRRARRGRACRGATRGARLRPDRPAAAAAHHRSATGDDVVVQRAGGLARRGACRAGAVVGLRARLGRRAGTPDRRHRRRAARRTGAGAVDATGLGRGRRSRGRHRVPPVRHAERTGALLLPALRHVADRCGRRRDDPAAAPCAVVAADVPRRRGEGLVDRRDVRAACAPTASPAAGISGKAMLFRTGGVVLVLGGLLAFLGPWSGPAKTKVRELIGADRHSALDVGAGRGRVGGGRSDDHAGAVRVAGAGERRRPLRQHGVGDALARSDRARLRGAAERHRVPAGGDDRHPPRVRVRRIRATSAACRSSAGAPRSTSRGRCSGGRVCSSCRWTTARARTSLLDDVGELVAIDFDHDDVSTRDDRDRRCLRGRGAGRDRGDLRGRLREVVLK